ncbi:hypothetical protein Tco_1410493 [Tanacetum coccineum]
MQLQARSHKEMCVKWFRALQMNTRFLLREDFISLNSVDKGAFEQAFLQLFGEEFSTVKRIFSQNMDNLEEQLTKEKLHENDSNAALTTLMTPFQSPIQALEASLVVTKSSGTESENISSDSTFGRSENENRSSEKESSSSEGNDANADISPSYDSDTVTEVPHSNNNTFENVFAHGIQNHEQPESIPDTYVVSKNNSNIISDIPNMDPDRDKEEHDYVAYEKQCAFFASLINNLKYDFEKCNKVNREAQQANALLTNELERYKEKEKHFKKDKTIESE